MNSKISKTDPQIFETGRRVQKSVKKCKKVRKSVKNGHFFGLFWKSSVLVFPVFKTRQKNVEKIPFDLARKTEKSNPNCPKISKNFDLDFVFGPEKSKRGPVLGLGRNNEGPVYREFRAESGIRFSAFQHFSSPQTRFSAIFHPNLVVFSQNARPA